MALVMCMGFSSIGVVTTASDEMGTVSIDREDGLVHGKDRYKYTAAFNCRSWNGGNSVEVEFTARYSDGALSLVSEAIRHLLKAHPELKAGRYGVPRNRAKCRKCGTVVWSQTRHDFTRCRCGAIALDGGYDYRKVCGNLKDVEWIYEPWQKKTVKRKPRTKSIMELTTPKHLRGFTPNPRRG